jgi:predicted nucleotidyltransferase
MFDFHGYDDAIPKRRGRRGYPIDLVPFGGVEDPAATIAWPPDRSIVMNVAGYREAFEAAPQVEIDAGLVVRVVSLPGLAILKLFAWADRGAGDYRRRDEELADLVAVARALLGQLATGLRDVQHAYARGVVRRIWLN